MLLLVEDPTLAIRVVTKSIVFAGDSFGDNRCAGGFSLASPQSSAHTSKVVQMAG